MADQTRPELMSSFELFTPSTALIRKYVGVFFVLLVLPLLLTNFDFTNEGAYGPLAMLGGILYILFFAPLIYAQTRAAGGHTVSLQESFSKGYTYFWRLLGLGIVVGLLVFIGFILLIVPGLIAIRRYILSPYLLVDQDLPIGEAMKRSAEISKPFSWSVYGILGVSLLISLVSVFWIIGFIASVIMSILYSLAPALRYFEIKKAYKALPLTVEE